jgi:hypothetical protein
LSDTDWSRPILDRHPKQRIEYSPSIFQVLPSDSRAFVVDTRLAPGARLVTCGNGMVIREPIVNIDDEAKRVVWSEESDQLTHYNASAQVFNDDNGRTKMVWIADLLPNGASEFVAQMMGDGMTAMNKTLDALAASV